MHLSHLVALSLLLLVACGSKEDTADSGHDTPAAPGPGAATGAGTGTTTATGTGTGSPSSAGACPDAFPADRVGIQWDFRTQHADGEIVDWTQEVKPGSGGHFALVTDIEGTVATTWLRCGAAGEVDMMGGESAGSGVSTAFTYDPPMRMWPGGDPGVDASWTSSGRQQGSWVYGGLSGDIDSPYTSTWTVTAVDTTWDLDGTPLTDCTTLDRTTSTEVNGAAVSTEEQVVLCGALYGQVWSQVETTTTAPGGPPLVETSTTTLLEVRFP